MKHKKRGINKVIRYALALSLPTMSLAQQDTKQCLFKTKTKNHPATPISEALDWQQSKNFCGGYFLTPPITESISKPSARLIQTSLHYSKASPRK